MGAVLAAIAGLMTTLYYGVVTFNDGFLPGMKAFTAAVLGGIDSIPGAILGGLLIGITESLWSGFFSSDYKDIAAFTILILVLIFKPSGFLGQAETQKV
jgi:branched-chain amino acid transport system permease protein